MNIAALWTLSGLAAAAAAYAYPPIRLQVLMSAILVATIDRPWERAGRWTLVPIMVAGLALVPLAQMHLQAGDFGARGRMLAVWNEDWMLEHNHAPWDLPIVVLNHLAAHLDPAYLFLHGDRNLRHSIGFGGIIGPVGLTLIVLTSALVPRFLVSRESLLLAGLFIAGLLAASLTWEALPHALRSLGAVGPLMLWSGIATAVLLRSAAPTLGKRIAGVLLTVAVLGAWRFGHAYFVDYPARSTAWFGGALAQAMDDDQFWLPRRYFAMRDHGQACRHSE
jgi:hypothetical protein